MFTLYFFKINCFQHHPSTHIQGPHGFSYYKKMLPLIYVTYSAHLISLDDECKLRSSHTVIFSFLSYLMFIGSTYSTKRLKFFYIKYKNSVYSLQEAHYISTTKINQLMLFREIFSVYCESHMKHTNTFCRQNE
jgi:hypothetical protein